MTLDFSFFNKRGNFAKKGVHPGANYKCILFILPDNGIGVPNIRNMFLNRERFPG
jgi:hypothetical protein